MNKLNEIHQNVLQQELNDTSGVIDVKIIENKNKKIITSENKQKKESKT